MFYIGSESPSSRQEVRLRPTQERATLATRVAPKPTRTLRSSRQQVNMDRFDVIKFDDLTGPGGGEWIKIGGGSFGVVFRGEYLGTEVAIKEVLPNNTYDVEKYFERECVLMKEARHPNIVQYIGLTKSPGADGRIYIISEFVGGNLRSYIADKSKPFDWPTRVSFATDIARAVAYLHARNCLHRDLKGENLLITANNRIKVCDFGFARIAARNEEEMRRISYCGTDGYMSPEILMGIDFSLPSDIFSLGVIFCEIISRHLVDANTFKRMMPTFAIEEDEVREMASKGCPADFIQLCLDCCQVEAADRPDMRQVIKRLRIVEQEVIKEEIQKGTLNNVGSLRGSSLHAIMQGSKKNKTKNGRPPVPRLPSFEGQIKVGKPVTAIREESRERSASEESDEDMEEALKALENVNIGLTGNGKDANKMALKTIKVASTFKVSGHGNPWWDEDSNGTINLPMSWVQHGLATEDQAPRQSTLRQLPAMQTQNDMHEEYSTSVIRPSKVVENRNNLADTLSNMSSKESGLEEVEGSHMTIRHRSPLGDGESAMNSMHLEGHLRQGELSEAVTLTPSTVVKHTRVESEEGVTESYMTAKSYHHPHEHQRDQDPSLAMATIATSSIYEPSLLYHRFTLIKNGTRRPASIDQTMESRGLVLSSSSTTTSTSTTGAWGGNLIPPQLILANALTKCNVCNKRLGFGAYMDCDDCPYKTHVSCGAMAEPNCQEMHIPTTNGPNSPVLTPLNAAYRRGSVPEEALRLTTPPTAAAALTKMTTTPAYLPKKDKDAKSPPGSYSRGVNLFRKRNSKSPPPKTTAGLKT
ncbi:hypothetical protein CBS101457_000716 [Exobasidium rhododendri]|nr:hypothetical protein CBS101457_000716 [Exobasidium rhododendri]